MKQSFSTYLCSVDAALSRYLKAAGRDEASGGHPRRLMDDSAQREFVQSELYDHDCPVEQAATLITDEFYP